VRARIVLAAAGGQSNAGIARELRIVVDTVRKRRTRFRQHGLSGLRDRPRSGRPRVFAATVVAEVKALACELPTQSEVPLARWSCPELAREATGRGICAQVSPSTVRRWLAQDAIKPWQHRSWIFPRDPHFATRAARVLDLYARIWEGEPLGENDFVLSSDENPVFKPDTESTTPCLQERVGRCGWNPNTVQTARWPTSPPVTSIEPR